MSRLTTKQRRARRRGHPERRLTATKIQMRMRPYYWITPNVQRMQARFDREVLDPLVRRIFRHIESNRT